MLKRKLQPLEKRLIFSDTLIVILPSLLIGYMLEIIIKFHQINDLGILTLTKNPFLFFMPAVFMSFYKIYIFSNSKYNEIFVKKKLTESHKIGKKVTISTWIGLIFAIVFQLTQ